MVHLGKNEYYPKWKMLKDKTKLTLALTNVSGHAGEDFEKRIDTEKLETAVTITPNLKGIGKPSAVADVRVVALRESDEIIEQRMNPVLLPDVSTAFEGMHSTKQPDVKSVVESINTVQKTRPKFPFKNTSHPGDSDNDILPYLLPVKRQKNARKSQNHYFLFKSDQAFQEKQ